MKGAWKKSSKIDPEQCYILSLPEELIVKIFSYLDPDTLVSIIKYIYLLIKKKKSIYRLILL